MGSASESGGVKMVEEKQILLVGDARFAGVVTSALQSSNLQISWVEDISEAGGLIPEPEAGLVVLSAEQRSGHCADYIKALNQLKPGLAVLVVARIANKAHAVECVSAGAADYLVEPLDSIVLQNKVEQLLVQSGRGGLIAQAPSTRHCAQLARRAAVSDASILITGETGTGKEVFARYVHENSSRSSQPFVAVNCAAIPETMLESILFGHEKGAFTGASARRKGKFEQAAGGTLFLDEITEMPMEQQAKLLRALQEKEIERLGGAEPVKVDVRVVSASNRDLQERVSQGLFREDLYYRLNVFPLHLRPLRERREDILPLANRVLRKAVVGSGQPVLELSAEAAIRLQQYNWPGNVRELENLCTGQNL